MARDCSMEKERWSQFPFSFLGSAFLSQGSNEWLIHNCRNSKQYHGVPRFLIFAHTICLLWYWSLLFDAGFSWPSNAGQVIFTKAKEVHDIFAKHSIEACCLG